MTLIELKARVDYALRNGDRDNMEVVIPNNQFSMGGLTTTKVRGANRGIDWNNNVFIIWPEVDMINKPKLQKFNPIELKPLKNP